MLSLSKMVNKNPPGSKTLKMLGGPWNEASLGMMLISLKMLPIIWVLHRLS